MENGNGLQKFNKFITHEKTSAYLSNVMGKRKDVFAANLVSLVSNEKSLMECTPSTVMYAALKATAYNFALDNSLGFAYVLPYNNKQRDANGKEVWIKEAQFQIGWKGFVQLALRTNQFETINVTDVRNGEIVGIDRLSGEYKFNWSDSPERHKEELSGYVAYFKLKNGFSKYLYMTLDELNEHGKKYSKSFDKNYSNWKKNFESMASKTVIKLLLSKYAPLSLDMQEAIKVDQAVIRGEDEIDYVDGDGINQSKVDQVASMFEEPVLVTIEQA